MAIGDRERAFGLMKRGNPKGALPLLVDLLQDDPEDANLQHLTGECLRFLDRVSEAIPHLKKSTELSPETAPYWLALGISLQLVENFNGAVDALKMALEIDSDHVGAFNSLALTQKKAGDPESAEHNYDCGAKALARTIAKGLTNSRSNPILKHSDTKGNIWPEHAMYAALYLAAQDDGLKSIAWPTAEQAIEEERTENHEGLYWTSFQNDDGDPARLYLPNYFNTFRASLRANPVYANLMGNRGVVLKMLGRAEEAEEHFSEAEEFSNLS